MNSNLLQQPSTPPIYLQAFRKSGVSNVQNSWQKHMNWQFVYIMSEKMMFLESQHRLVVHFHKLIYQYNTIHVCKMYQRILNVRKQ